MRTTTVGSTHCVFLALRCNFYSRLVLSQYCVNRWKDTILPPHQINHEGDSRDELLPSYTVKVCKGHNLPPSTQSRGDIHEFRFVHLFTMWDDGIIQDMGCVFEPYCGSDGRWRNFCFSLPSWMTSSWFLGILHKLHIFLNLFYTYVCVVITCAPKHVNASVSVWVNVKFVTWTTLYFDFIFRQTCISCRNALHTLNKHITNISTSCIEFHLTQIKVFSWICYFQPLIKYAYIQWKQKWDENCQCGMLYIHIYNVVYITLEKMYLFGCLRG